MAGIIAAIPEAEWQAIKITQHGHQVCSTDGAACDCVGDLLHPYALDEQMEPDSTDSGRYLSAGAKRSYWLRTAKGELGYAMEELRRLLAAAENTIVESNSLLRFLTPDLYVMSLDYSVEDMKDSARQYMDRADAYVVVERGPLAQPWKFPSRWFAGKPLFRVKPPEYCPPELGEFVRARWLSPHTRSK